MNVVILMLYIDKKIEVSDQKIFVGTYTKNGNKGYNINIQLLFINIDNIKIGTIEKFARTFRA